MTLDDALEAVKKRVSCRAFDAKRPIEPEALEKLAAAADEVNEASGLRIRLVNTADEGQQPLALGESMFHNAPACYFALVGPKSPRGQELVGYYGEELVLLATTLGLGTCWVAGTFDRSSVDVTLADFETLHGVIPVGYPARMLPFRQRSIRKNLRKKNRSMNDLFDGPLRLNRSPLWIQAGVGAIWAGPSAVNEQPVVIRQSIKDAPVSAFVVPERATTDLAAIDLGIAKLHFQMAAASQGMEGTWQWGDGGSLIPSVPEESADAGDGGQGTGQGAAS